MKSMQTADFTITTYPDKVLKLTYYIFLLFLHSEALLIFEKKNSDVFGFWGKSPHITIFRILAHCVRCWFGPETFRLDVSKRYHDKLRYYLMALLVSKLASLFSRR